MVKELIIMLSPILPYNSQDIFFHLNSKKKKNFIFNEEFPETHENINRDNLLLLNDLKIMKK